MRRNLVVLSLFLILIISVLLTWDSTPARSQSPSLQKIESDAPQVIQVGNWVSQPASGASGGSYLFNAPPEAESSQEAALQLEFSGTSVEVLYVSGPGLGTLAMEVDGTVLRTVITTADTTQYGQAAQIDYLTDEAHTLRVYAQEGGVVGVDAFVVQNLTDAPVNVETPNVPRDGLGSGTWMATYVRRFPTTATCAIPNLNLMSLPSGSVIIPGTFPTSEINFNWGSGGPAQVAPSTDTFAIVFERTLNFSQDTTLTISYMADDAIHIYDNETLLTPTNRWDCAPNAPGIINRTFTAGDHVLRVEYVEITRSAQIIVTFSVPLLTAAPQSTTQVDLSWLDGLTGVTNYHVERSPSGLNNWTEIATISSPASSYSDLGLVCGTYDYRVRAYFSATDTFSQYSNVATAYTGPCLSNPPTNLTAEAVGFGQLQMSWTDNAPDETEYRIERSYTGSSGWFELATVPADTTTFTDSWLHCTQSYWYRVRGYRSGDMAYSAYSNSVEGITLGCLVDEPTNLTATALDRTQIQLNWTDNSSSETEFHISRSLSGSSNWTFYTIIPGNTTTFINTGLSCGTAYDYRVSAYRQDDGSMTNYSTIATAMTLPCPLITPTGLTATALDSGQIRLVWADPNSDETEFRIERSPNGTTDWMEIGVAPANTTTYTNVSLICNTTYHYRVRAYRASDTTYSSYSNVANATTVACPANCGAVQERIQRLSVGMGGGATDDGGWIGRRSLSDDGRYAVFSSYADNLVPIETTWSEVFLFDRMTCQTTLISIDLPSNTSNWSPSISGDGRYILFESGVMDPTPSAANLFLHDRLTGTTIVVSNSIDDPTISSGFWGMLSGNGRYVAFVSEEGLIPSDTNNAVDVYVRDLQSNTLEIASLTSAGALSSGESAYPYISYDGRYVTFISSANLVPEDTVPEDNLGYDVYLRDMVNNTTTLVSYGDDEAAHGARSDMPHMNTNFWVIYAPVTPDGRYVAFVSSTAGMTVNNTAEPQGGSNVYLRDVLNGTTTLASVGANGNSFIPSISDDGRYIVFSSDANNFIVGDTNYYTDVYMYDRLTETISWLSRTFDGGVPNNESETPYITPDGRYVSFNSGASNLLPEGGYPGMVLVERSLLFAPGSFLASTSGRSAITLNWSDANADETEFSIEQSLNGTSWAVIATLPANTTNYLNENLVCGTTHHYRVRAYRASDTTYSAYSNVANTTTNACLPVAPSNLSLSVVSSIQINLVWMDNSSDETQFRIERSPDGATGWTEVGQVGAGITSHQDMILRCATSYFYRVRAYRNGDAIYSAYSNIANATTAACLPDALAIVNPATRSANLVHSLTNPPASGDYTQFATGFPYGTGGQYLTGDWNGDGLETLGVYRNGAFFFTNDYGTGATWGGVWFGLGGQPVAGRFDANVGHDCLGVTDSGTWTNGDTYFALYFTCNLTSGPTPPLTFQWLSILLPNSVGFTGTHQFVAGDFDGDGVDSIAVRRGNVVAWTNVPPTNVYSAFQYAQYLGAPGTGDEGRIVVGDWDLNNVDSFGLVYQNGTFYRRNDVEWNTGVYIFQQFTPLVGTPFDVTSWRPH